MVFDCKNVLIDSLSFNLSPAFDQTKNITLLSINHEDISTDLHSLLLNPCNTIISPIECKDSYACRTILNIKENHYSLTSAKTYKNDPIISFSKNILSILYSSSNSNISISLSCSKDSNTIPSVSEYLPDSHIALSWNHPIACITSTPAGIGNHANDSFLGILKFSPLGNLFFYFFTFLFTYFIIGIIYNYALKNGSNYSLTSLERQFPELLPHHTFWIRFIEILVDSFYAIVNRCRGNQSYLSI
ncbi:hypothetical protein BC833DRAFT_603413 [Globomyces pollinis-pini]|nr:hypothetical protein BC833DRAFT_603413 [Globomyces pollinis-pini]